MKPLYLLLLLTGCMPPTKVVQPPPTASSYMDDLSAADKACHDRLVAAHDDYGLVHFNSYLLSPTVANREDACGK